MVDAATSSQVDSAAPARGSGLSGLVARHAGFVLGISGVLMVISAALVPGLHARMSSGWTLWDDAASANVQAREVISRTAGFDTQQGYIMTVRLNAPINSGSAAPQVLDRAVALLRARPEVKDIIDYRTAPHEGLISADGTSTVAFARVGPVVEKEATADLQRQLANDQELAEHVTLGGPTVGNAQVTDVVLEDLALAEFLVFPALFVLLIVVFRGVVAALVPLLGGGVTVLLAMLAMRGVVEFSALSVYSLNLVLALGLGLSIDFSLLITTRYREQLALNGPGFIALQRTMRTAGRTVLFSGLTVGSALLSLLVFPQRVVVSMGIAGIIATGTALLYGLIVLPAVLYLLGTRIETWAPRRWQRRSRESGVVDPSARRWRRVAVAVMARPVVLAAVATGVLLLMASPLVGVKFTGAQSPTVLPVSVSAGQVAQQLRTSFPMLRTDTEYLLVSAPASDRAEVTTFANAVSQVDGVAAVTDPQRLDDSHWLVTTTLNGEPISAASQDTMRSIDRIKTGFTVKPAGPTSDVLALNASLGDHLPAAALILVLTTLAMLFAMTGSVVLPVKTVIMNALSLGAALGLITMVFQYGWLAGLFGISETGALESTAPLYLGAVAFGLATDYGIFVLSRIKEARDDGAGERESVAAGIEQTGRIVTSAAALFCLAMCALLISRLDFIKELGLGAALAVIIDATIVRAILVPALMTILGRRNWWAPPLLRRLHTWLRLDRIERATPPSPIAPGSHAPSS